MINMRQETRRNRQCLCVSILLHLLLLLLWGGMIDKTALVQQHAPEEMVSAVMISPNDLVPNKIVPRASQKPRVLQALATSSQTLASVTPSLRHIPVKHRVRATLKHVVPPHHLTVVKSREHVVPRLLKRRDHMTDHLAHQSAMVERNRQQIALTELLKRQTATVLQRKLLDSISKQALQYHQQQGVVDQYKALILQSISHHWLVPIQANKHIYCDLLIQLAPGGEVLGVRVLKNSGNVALEQSARAAVFAASPLPVPHDSHVFARFKQIVLRVKPLTTESW